MIHAIITTKNGFLGQDSLYQENKDKKSLVITFILKKEYKKAELFQLQLLSALKAAPFAGESNINAMAYLARIYLGQRRCERSRRIRLKIFLCMRGFYGKAHPTTINAMMDLAFAYCLEGNVILAERLQRKALPLYYEVLGERHEMTVSAMEAAGFICRVRGVRGLVKKADELEKRAIFLRHKFDDGILPSRHSNIDFLAAERSDEASTRRIIAAVIRHKRAASTRRRNNVSVSRKRAAYTRHKTAASTRRWKMVSASRKMAAFLRRRMERKYSHRQLGQLYAPFR
jgi:hypothetical protein